MTWFMSQFALFLIVFTNGNVSEVYNGRVTRVSANRAAFARVNGSSANVSFSYRHRRVKEVIW